MEITNRYDSAAPTWDQRIHALGYDHAYCEFLRSNVLASGSVLDVGTGTGSFARAWIKSQGSQDITLLDASPRMLEQARSAMMAEGILPRTVRVPIGEFVPQVPYRAILAAHVVEHCENAGDAVRRFADWLEPHGRLFLVISKPHWCNWFIWLRFRHRWFSADQVRHYGQAAGLNYELTHSFRSGPPSRTSLGYLFSKPERISQC